MYGNKVVWCEICYQHFSVFVSLRQLLMGAETLSLVSQMLSSIDKVSEKIPETWFVERESCTVETSAFQ